MVLQAPLSRGANLATPKISLGHVDYFQLDTIKSQKTQEDMLTFPLTAQRMQTEDLLSKGAVATGHSLVWE